jgi:hypothetical protein
VTRSLDDELFGISDQAEDYDYVSDSDLEDDDEVVESPTKTHEPAAENQNSNATVGNRNELAHKGKVVALRGVSYLTSVRVPLPPLYSLVKSLIASKQL